MLRRFLSLVACAFLMCAATAYAQEITGTIAGTVKDAAGASVAGATVTITDLDKKIIARTVTTNDEGVYSAPDLPVGNYEVAVEAPNFKKYVATKVKLDVAQRRTIDATLEAGQVAEVVTVEAEPLQVDLQTPTAANLISGTQVRELSLNNRNFVQLTALMPGVSSNLADQVYVGTTNPNGEANTVSIAVNGARSAANNWTVDGADNTDRGSNLTIMMYPSVDAIGEFKVSRSLYPADTGRAGGGQVNVVTKSGTNQFHGSAYEFVRNERLNANRFFINANPNSIRDTNGKAKRPPLRYNNFGWTLGGPLPTPHFGEGGPSVTRGKSFFFFSEEWRRTITYTEFRPTVPTTALKQGTFPVYVCVQFSGSTCTQASNQITNINPVAAGYIRDIFSGVPDPAPGGFTLTAPLKNLFFFRQEILRLDHTFSKKLNAFYRFENDKIPTEEPMGLFTGGVVFPPGVATTKTDSPGKSHVARATYAFTPTTIFDGGYSYTRGAIFSDPTGNILNQRAPDVQVPLPFPATIGRIPTLNSGFSRIGGFGPYRNFSTYHQWNMNLSRIMGSHTMKFGGQLHFFRKFENAGGGNEGSFSFPTTPRPTATTPGVPAGAAVVTASNSFLQQWANFLLGNVSSFTQTRFDITADIRARNHEFFAQDEWRVRRNLTLYYGARYSLFRQPFDNNNLLTNFDPAAYSAARAFGVDPVTGNRVGSGDPLNGIIVQGQNSPFGNKVGRENNHNVGPRIGLAWDPFKDGKTAVRTGYGIYYDVPLYGIYEQNEFTNPPFNDSITITNTRLENPSAGVTSISAAPRSLRGTPVDDPTPYYQHWSFDVQRQIFSKTLLDVGYYGSKGTHLPGILDINLIQPGLAFQAGILPAGQHFTAANEPRLDVLRPFKGYRAINVIQNRFNSNYNSLQVFFQQRFTGSNYFNLAYTWSHNLTDNQSDRSNAPQNPYNIRSEYGRASLDRRHILTFNYVYEVPFFRNRKDLAGHVLGGWQLSGITSYYSGLPFTVTTLNGEDPAGVGFLGPSAAGPRPNMVCDPNRNAPHTIAQWFNTQCFQDVPAGVNAVGNAPRGAVNGPSVKRWDLTLTKNIHFRESMRIQLRGEAFNIFNHTNFNAISTALGSSTFGQLTGTRDPRTIQLGIKFNF